MVYSLRIPGDDARKPEFKIEPARGAVAPKSESRIQLDFLPTMHRLFVLKPSFYMFLIRCSYDMYLAVDIEGVGEEMATIPIFGECVVPEVVVITPVIDFARCFLGYPYKKVVDVIPLSFWPSHVLIDRSAAKSV
jgi:hydrocephalus-inducing protein